MCGFRRGFPSRYAVAQKSLDNTDLGDILWRVKNFKSEFQISAREIIKDLSTGRKKKKSIEKNWLNHDLKFLPTQYFYSWIVV